jgi:hypothetical protein
VPLHPVRLALGSIGSSTPATRGFVLVQIPLGPLITSAATACDSNLHPGSLPTSLRRE